MPQWTDPERGWIATANNRPAANDFPYPLSGTWNDGLRARRIRQIIEEKNVLSREDFSAMHRDGLALRAVRCLPGLLTALKASPQRPVQEEPDQLQAWDCRMEPDRVGALIFEVFYLHWTRVVVQQRFEGETAALLSGGAANLAAALLSDDRAGWFAPGGREPAIGSAMEAALAWLEQRLGPDRTQWTWGRLHTLPLRHVLSGRGDLGQLLDHGGLAVTGNATTVCNTTPGAAFEARLGGAYRMIADLNAEPPTLLAIDAQGQSGHPGSPYYGQQLKAWLEGQYHELRLDRMSNTSTAIHRLHLIPIED
jgi:penicillin amidase